MLDKPGSRFWGTSVLTCQANWKVSSYCSRLSLLSHPDGPRTCQLGSSTVLSCGCRVAEQLGAQTWASWSIFNFLLWGRISLVLTNLLVLCSISSNLHSYFLYQDDLNYTQHCRSPQVLYACTVSLITFPAPMPAFPCLVAASFVVQSLFLLFVMFGAEHTEQLGFLASKTLVLPLTLFCCCCCSRCHSNLVPCCSCLPKLSSTSSSVLLLLLSWVQQRQQLKAEQAEQVTAVLPSATTLSTALCWWQRLPTSV